MELYHSVKNWIIYYIVQGCDLYIKARKSYTDSDINNQCVIKKLSLHNDLGHTLSAPAPGRKNNSVLLKEDGSIIEFFSKDKEKRQTYATEFMNDIQKAIEVCEDLFNPCLAAKEEDGS